MGQPINRSIEILLGAIQEATGAQVKASAFLGALIGQIEKVGVTEEANAITIGYHRLIKSHSRALNLELSRDVSCWALHALGPDAPLRESYPLYRSLAQASGIVPWGFVWFQTHAYTTNDAKRLGEAS